MTGGMHPDIIATQERQIMVPAHPILRVLNQQRTIGIDITIMPGNKGALRMRFEAETPDLQGAGQQAVIGVEKDHIVALAVAQTRIAGGGKALVLLPDVLHTWIARSDLCRLVD